MTCLVSSSLFDFCNAAAEVGDGDVPRLFFVQGTVHFSSILPRLLNIEKRLCHQPKKVKPKKCAKYAEFDHI